MLSFPQVAFALSLSFGMPALNAHAADAAQMAAVQTAPADTAVQAAPAAQVVPADAAAQTAPAAQVVPADAAAQTAPAAQVVPADAAAQTAAVPAAAPATVSLQGKKVSILGDSISTFTGTHAGGL